MLRQLLRISLLASLGAFVVGTALLGFAASRQQDVVGTLASSIGGAVFTLGLVGLLYEWAFRGSVTRDVLEAVQLSQTLAASHIIEVADEESLQWGDALLDGADFELLLVDPTAWMQREWIRVLEAGQRRTISILLYLPDPDSSSFGELADTLGIQPEEFRQTIGRVVKQAENSWNLAKNDQPRLRKGSTIDVKLYTGFPSQALIRVDNRLVVVVHAALGRTPGTAAYRFDVTDADSFPARWFLGHLRHLRDVGFPSSYKDEVRD